MPDNGIHDPLLTFDRVASHAGLTFTVNRPVKDPANPLITPEQRTTADWGTSYQSCVYKDGVWHLLYPALHQTSGWSTCYAYSTDGQTFIRPELDEVVRNGTSGNNIIQTGIALSIRWDDYFAKWVMTQENYNDTRGLFIWLSDEPYGPFTLAKHLTYGPAFQEGKEVVRRNDDRLIGYRVSGHGKPGSRALSAWISDTPDPAGEWTFLDEIIPSGGSADQRYGIGVHRVHDFYYGLVMRMNADEYTDPPGDYNTGGSILLQMWVSRDALTWTMVDGEWLTHEGIESEAWDACLATIGNRFAEVDDEWQVYYSGHPNPRLTLTYELNGTGRAIVPRGRIGQAAGTGELTTDPLGMPRTPTLTVNADAVGGSLRVEVLDAEGSPIPGFTEADSDPITTDVYDAVPTWNGSPFAGTGTVSLRFVLTDAKLHGYSIAGVPSARRPARLTGGAVSIGGFPARISSTP